MTRRRTNPPFLNGVPELLLLHLLSRRPMHGYELVQAIKQATNRELQFGEGCIYPILHRLEAQGVLSASAESVAGRSRVVYRLTPKGRKQLGDSVRCWQRVVGAINRALQGEDHAEPVLA
jgi:PadR family transcriptional regulator PadR